MNSAHPNELRPKVTSYPSLLCLRTLKPFIYRGTQYAKPIANSTVVCLVENIHQSTVSYRHFYLRRSSGQTLGGKKKKKRKKKKKKQSKNNKSPALFGILDEMQWIQRIGRNYKVL